MTIEQLENKIIKASQFYYSGLPTISDKAFDDLVEYLRAVDPTNPLLVTTGWGYDPMKAVGTKENHLYGEVIGIDKKPRTIEDIPNGFEDDLMLSAKLDGLSIVCYFNNGSFFKALTRGNGKVGINRTDKVAKILEKELYNDKEHPFDFTGAIRGEVCISNANWKIMQALDIAGESQRNTAAGIINRDEILDDIKYVDIVFYKVIGYQKTNSYFNNLLEERLNINNLFDTLFLNKFIKNQYLALTKYITKSDKIDYATITQEMLEALYEKFNIEYPCDGIVISKPTKSIYNSGNFLGIIPNECAYKFEGETKNAKVLSITWKMSKGNLAKPVVNIEPIELSGATVRNATAYNAQYIKDNDVIPGSIVEILRSGEVIPKIVNVIDTEVGKGIKYLESITCPVCNATLKWEGVDLICDNDNCSNRDYQNLRIWVNSLAETDGIGETLIFKFFKELNINSIEELYSKTFDELEYKDVKPNSHKGKFNKVLDKLFKSPIDFKKILMAFNIKMLGETNAEKLSNNNDFVLMFQNLIKNDFVGPYDYDLLKNIIGDVFSKTFFNSTNIVKLKNVKYLKGREIIHDVKESSITKLIPVVITGNLDTFKTREDFVVFLKEFGYEAKSGVNKKTRYLITNHMDNTTKFKKAKELGIEIINEKDFLKLIKKD